MSRNVIQSPINESSYRAYALQQIYAPSLLTTTKQILHPTIRADLAIAVSDLEKPKLLLNTAWAAH
jgi:hypothetical protein